MLESSKAGARAQAFFSVSLVQVTSGNSEQRSRHNKDCQNSDRMIKQNIYLHKKHEIQKNMKCRNAQKLMKHLFSNWKHKTTNIAVVFLTFCSKVFVRLFSAAYLLACCAVSRFGRN